MTNETPDELKPAMARLARVCLTRCDAPRMTLNERTKADGLAFEFFAGAWALALEEYGTEHAMAQELARFVAVDLAQHGLAAVRELARWHAEPGEP
jgi:hypothetical protein